MLVETEVPFVQTRGPELPLSWLEAGVPAQRAILLLTAFVGALTYEERAIFLKVFGVSL